MSHSSSDHVTWLKTVVTVTVNDMPSVVDPGTTVGLFADNTLIYRVIHSVELVG